MKKGTKNVHQKLSAPICKPKLCIHYNVTSTHGRANVNLLYLSFLCTHVCLVDIWGDNFKSLTHVHMIHF